MLQEWLEAIGIYICEKCFDGDNVVMWFVYSVNSAVLRFSSKSMHSTIVLYIIFCYIYYIIIYYIILYIFYIIDTYQIIHIYIYYIIYIKSC